MAYNIYNHVVTCVAEYIQQLLVSVMYTHVYIIEGLRTKVAYPNEKCVKFLKCPELY